MQKSSRIIWGVVLIAVGAVLALNAFDIAHIDLFFDGWWTLFIIVPCTVGLFTEHDKTGNIIGIAIGVFLLLCCQDVIGFDMLWKLAIPAVVIFVGLKMVFGGLFNNKSNAVLKAAKQSGVPLKNGTATFGGVNMNLDGEVFRGAELNAIFGGVKCDLSHAVIEEDAVINASAIFGGIDIFVPDNVNIKVYSNSLFGGVSDKKKRPADTNHPTVYINATCMFGGVDIK